LLSAHPDACGRAGQGSRALELFQNMRDDGLAADRVAYNALFSALRVSEDADRVSFILLHSFNRSLRLLVWVGLVSDKGYHSHVSLMYLYLLCAPVPSVRYN
jgi:pentatricopeptide repeat protein